ncbi:MAG: hypothetical protein GSR84_07180 [Desulfurococcales archaeon]|nr:hypothetical protein [Desulfurococcales archaeon]
MDARILGPLEFTLGVLAMKPRSPGEVLELAERYGRGRNGPLVTEERVQATLRMLAQAGVLAEDRDGRLRLRLEALHPAYQAIALSAVKTIAVELDGAADDR